MCVVKRKKLKLLQKIVRRAMSLDILPTTAHLYVLYQLLDSRNLYKSLHHFVHATIYITTFPVYPFLTTTTLY